MEPRLTGDGKPSVSWILGPVLVFSFLPLLVSCHETCKHRAPSPSEVVHVYLKHERLTKRSSPDDLQLKIKIIYDYSVDQLPADKRRLVKHSLTCTADLVLERLSQRVSALTTSGFGSELESDGAQEAEEKEFTDQ